MATVAEIIERWDSGDGKPYKGSLIDRAAYADDPTNIGCMCAQGQVLHLVGGVSADDLMRMKQAQADAETAKLLNISRAHAVLLRNVNDGMDGAPAIVLTHPEKVLGDKAQTLLAFWHHMDTLDAEGWGRVDAAWAAAGAAARDAAWAAARDAAWAAARDAAWAAAGAAARDAAWAAAWAAAGAAAWAAAREIQGADKMRERCQPLFFLPMFGFANPESIPALPANYGVGK